MQYKNKKVNEKVKNHWSDSDDLYNEEVMAYWAMFNASDKLDLSLFLEKCAASNDDPVRCTVLAALVFKRLQSKLNISYIEAATEYVSFGGLLNCKDYGSWLDIMSDSICQYITDMGKNIGLNRLEINEHQSIILHYKNLDQE